MTCDGFQVTFMCDRRSRDCLHGSCWHMDRVRQMVRLWFSVVGPKPRMGTGSWERREPPEPKPMSPKERKAVMDAACKRPDECEKRHRLLYPEAYGADGKPKRFPTPWTNGIGWSPFPDTDGVGDWGKHVRQWEDREDEP